MRRIVLALLLLSNFGVFESVAADGGVPLHVVNGSVVKEWLVLGPFPALNLRSDFLLPMGGETNARPQAGEKVRGSDGSEFTWTRISGENFISFLPVFGSQEDAVAYAYCELESDLDGDARFELRAENAASVFLNGQSTGGTRTSAAAAPSFVAPVRQGRNRCLVKVRHEFGTWEMALRILPVNRAIIRGVVTDAAGTRLPAAVVQIYQDEQQIAEAKSNQTGAYVLDVFPVKGTFELRATWNRLGTWKRNLNLREGDRTRLELRIEDAVSFSGAVRGLDGKTPQTSIPVQALRLSNDGSAEDLVATVLTDERGDYQLVALRPGRYRIRCQTANGFKYYASSADPEGAERTDLEIGDR